jgi:ribosome-associated toxin RatA of RatAB toxin-antitoxin module
MDECGIGAKGDKMTIVKKSRAVPYTCEQMYQIVDGVEFYQEFLPYFEKIVVHHRDEDEVQATLVISFAGMQKSFTTRNRLQKNKMIEIRLIDGPFSHLEGFWRFDETGEGCMILLDLEFHFSTKMLSVLLSPFFEQVTSTMVDAFSNRADKLYGNG